MTRLQHRQSDDRVSAERPYNRQWWLQVFCLLLAIPGALLFVTILLLVLSGASPLALIPAALIGLTTVYPLYRIVRARHRPSPQLRMLLEQSYDEKLRRRQKSLDKVQTQKELAERRDEEQGRLALGPQSGQSGGVSEVDDGGFLAIDE